ncbi:MAG: protein phosphatase 2C domain-containing protein, partial [Myxococcota bacterium]
DLELTKLTLPSLDTLDEESATPASARDAVVPIVYDDDALVDEPTQQSAFILVSAVGQTDRGRKRRRNEDSFLMLQSPPVFVVADGMGGYAGGDVASNLAVDRIKERFAQKAFDKRAHPSLPRRGSELVQAMQYANQQVYERAQSDVELAEMGTTLVCARFSPNKQRVYIGHVGDSRAYLLRDGKLNQITTDHTAANEEGIPGPLGATLTRAVGIQPTFVVDLILGKPRTGDRYMLCSDGLTKMVKPEKIEALLAKVDSAEAATATLIDTANARGGKDNVTVIVVDVRPISEAPELLAKS